MDILRSVQCKLYRLIDYVRYDVPCGLHNLWLYAPVIWTTREWDFAHLYSLMAFKLRQMEKDQREFNLGDSQRRADQIQIAYTCLERLAKDEYPGFVEFCELGNQGRKDFPSHKLVRDEDMAKADLDLFCKLFKKHSRSWWS